MRNKVFQSVESTLLSLPRDLYEHMVNKLSECPENPKYHIEPNTFEHTKGVIDDIIAYEDQSIEIADDNIAPQLGQQHVDTLIVAAIFHDTGKAQAKAWNEKNQTFVYYDHERHSAKIVDAYSKWIKSMNVDPILVRNIVRNHMRIQLIDKMRPEKKQALLDLPFYNLLAIFTLADKRKLVEH